MTTAARNEFTMPELTPEQQKLLLELRRRRQEILLEIQVWRDMKCKTKKKLTYNKSECRATGGGNFNQKILSPLEETISNIIQLDKQFNPEGVVQGVANVADDSSDENVLIVSAIEIGDPNLIVSAQSPPRVLETATPAKRKRKPDDRDERQRLLEKHNSMQQRVLTEMTNTLASLQNSMKDINRYQRKLFEVEVEKLKLMQRAEERGKELHETEVKLKEIKMQIKIKELEILNKQYR